MTSYFFANKTPIDLAAQGEAEMNSEHIYRVISAVALARRFGVEIRFEDLGMTEGLEPGVASTGHGGRLILAKDLVERGGEELAQAVVDGWLKIQGHGPRARREWAFKRLVERAGKEAQEEAEGVMREARVETIRVYVPPKEADEDGIPW